MDALGFQTVFFASEIGEIAGLVRWLHGFSSGSDLNEGRGFSGGI